MGLPKIKLGRMVGITFQIDPTWFIVFLLITLSLVTHFSQQFPDWNPAYFWLAGLGTSLLFFVSVLLHELAHSLVAIAKGIPVRSITLFIFGGVAQISREANRPGTEFLVASAGPLASGIIACFYALLWWLTRGRFAMVSALAEWLVDINLLLAVFNMIPGFPLDGGRILRSIIWAISQDFNQATRVATTMGRVMAYLIITTGVVVAVFGEGNFLNGLWIGFIGWFLLTAAQRSQQQIQLREALSGIKANDLMTRDCPRVPVGITLSRFLDEFVFPSGRDCFLVMEQEMLRGVVTLHEVNRIPKPNWERTQLEDIMVPLERLRWVRPDQDVMKILEHMDREGISQVPVVDHGRLLGMVGRHEILHLLQSRLEVTA